MSNTDKRLAALSAMYFEEGYGIRDLTEAECLGVDPWRCDSCELAWEERCQDGKCPVCNKRLQFQAPRTLHLVTSEDTEVERTDILSTRELRELGLQAEGRDSDAELADFAEGLSLALSVKRQEKAAEACMTEPEGHVGEFRPDVARAEYHLEQARRGRAARARLGYPVCLSAPNYKELVANWWATYGDGLVGRIFATLARKDRQEPYTHRWFLGEGGCYGAEAITDSQAKTADEGRRLDQDEPDTLHELEGRPFFGDLWDDRGKKAMGADEKLYLLRKQGERVERMHRLIAWAMTANIHSILAHRQVPRQRYRAGAAGAKQAGNAHNLYLTADQVEQVEGAIKTRLAHYQQQLRRGMAIPAKPAVPSFTFADGVRPKQGAHLEVMGAMGGQLFHAEELVAYHFPVVQVLDTEVFYQ